MGDALTLLGDTERPTHPAAVFWRSALRLALHLIARGRLLPGLSPGDLDAWRVGPLDADDAEQITALAEAMPPEAHAVPLPSTGADPNLLPDPRTLVRAFLDAVADTLPRSPAAADATGTPAFAAAPPRRLPALRGWAEEIAAGADSGVRISLRLDTEDPVEDWADVGPGSFRVVVQLHSLADPTRVIDAAACWAATDAVPTGFDGRTRVDAVLAIRRAALHWEPLGRLLSQTVPAETAITDDEVFDLLGSAARRLAAAGVDVHLPRALGRDLTTRLVAGGGSTAPDTTAHFDDLQPLHLDWQLALGGHPLTDAERDLLAEAHRPVVRLRDQWLLVDPDLLDRARRTHTPPLPAVDALRLALAGHTVVDGTDVEVVAVDALETLRTRIADPEHDTEPVPAPAALAATLRDYQLRGLRWLDRMTSLGLGCCLADDMGLGKTITVIALHLHRRTRHPDTGPTLVVCPASLLGNWEREITRFAPHTPVRRFHGGTRTLDDVTDGIVLTTYATMRLDTTALSTVTWGLLVADEAQHVKNHRSRTATALRRIPTRARVALTGTPVENNLTELWAILDWTTPGLLGTLPSFRRDTAALHRPPTPGPDAPRDQAAHRLARLVRPFLLRRHKSDPGIAPELPAKTETDHPAPLTTEQTGLYEAVVRETLHRIASAEAMHRRGLILGLLTALKQICNHPAQYLKETRPRLHNRSGKLAVLDELVDAITAADGSVLVFTQYVAMARLLRDHLTGRGIPVQLLHGGTPVDRREEQIRRFQDGEVPVFLLSLKAAGTGLNLTRADHVVHYDRWWNPAVEAQATDRAHRIGQTRPVQVHRLIAEGTLEDRIAAMLAAKRDLADAVLTTGEQALTELTDSELAEAIELRSRP
ncbi:MULTISPECIES: DEAD/DEAH box helicase [Actinoalloteichus]|uniref:DEAD/DEAH box helicase n=1 Tax=Actinoalloteichus TaxID=65496 RepID=UPI001E462BE9|nr:MULTISPECIES: DEAD/DEAH box helicase [Actinoalloteichus]